MFRTIRISRSYENASLSTPNVTRTKLCIQTTEFEGSNSSDMETSNVDNPHDTSPMEVEYADDSATQPCGSFMNLEILTEVIERLTPDIKTAIRNKYATDPSSRGEYLIPLDNDKFDSVINAVINRPPHRLKPSSRRGKYFSKFLLVLSGAICVLLALMIVGDEEYFCNTELQMSGLKTDFKRVVSQEDVTANLLRAVRLVHKVPKELYILVFMGSSGVGKTYIANLIKRQFNQRYVFDINANKLELLHTKTLKSMSRGCCNLIIIDDLQVKDLDRLLELLQLLPQQSHTLVITIFNLQEVSNDFRPKIKYEYINTIQDGFNKFNTRLAFEFYVFNALSEGAVGKWLRGELQRRRVDVQYHDRIVTEVLRDVDVQHSGFKTVQNRLERVLGYWEI